MSEHSRATRSIQGSLYTAAEEFTDYLVSLSEVDRIPTGHDTVLRYMHRSVE
jgi:hypothetical protein